AKYILDMQKQLTLISSEARRESNGNLALEGFIHSMTTVDKVYSELSFMHQ
ncbi:vacuolar protein sorting-associated protein 18, partial [Trifolium medium]|nr:vacuolar protein sorting-associated protein 18 [Trifolium medium]